MQWETDARAAASAILFWIPRDLRTLPGFTTNVEFGLDVTKICVKLSAARRTEGGQVAAEDDHSALGNARCQRLRDGSASGVVPSLPMNTQSPNTGSDTVSAVLFSAATPTLVKWGVYVTLSSS